MLVVVIYYSALCCVFSFVFRCGLHRVYLVVACLLHTCLRIVRRLFRLLCCVCCVDCLAL